MKQNELIEGEIYSFIRKGYKGDNWNKGYFIGKFQKGNIFGPYIFSETNCYNSLRWEFKGSEEPLDIRLGNFREICQLLNSIESNKFIPLSEIKINEYYEIY